LTGRCLTPAETRLAESVFGSAIRYDDVRIHNDKWWWFQPRQIAMAPRGHIYFHPKGSLYCADMCDRGQSDQGLFIHEMAHVWQYQNGVNLILRRHPFCRYDYSLRPGWPLRRYGIEQQAEIVRHYFVLKNGGSVCGAPHIDAYASLLPFGHG
jgi:hypothetical protein